MTRVEQDIVKKAIDSNTGLAEYLYSIDYEEEHNGLRVDLEVMPLKFTNILLNTWKNHLKEKHIKWFDLVSDVKGETVFPEEIKDYSTKEEFRKFYAFKREIILSEKLIKNKATSLPKLSFKLNHIFSEKLGKRCWLYSLDSETGHYIPMIVRSVTYRAKNDRHKDYSRVDIVLSINTQNATSLKTIEITTDDFREHKKDALEILKSKNLFFETPAMFKQYEKDYADYKVKSLWQNLQVVYKGEKFIQDNVYHKENGRSRYGRGNSMNERVSSDFAPSYDVLMPVPYDMTIYAFNLGRHQFQWLKTPSVELYKYNPNISEKLILPEEHKDLINILLSDNIKAVGGDIIEGKGQGTIILAKGRAGIGKTATAEVYSEKKELPLYSVHSGQLSMDGVRIEDKLKEIFERAERWGCILLIDEADVFIRVRGDDISHNAIVASFLRTMEYYKSTLFMTTNRENDVDEAIESRCIAVLKYEMPKEDIREKLWELFIKQFKLTVKEGVIEELAVKMTDLSGRDIKNISMLVSRYSQGKGIKEIDFDVFKICATFRGKYAI